MQFPNPDDCYGMIGVVVGLLGGVIGLLALLFGSAGEWGFIILALSGWIAFTSVLVCLLWEWDHFRLGPPTSR
jgi:hypothetical protein